MRLSSTNHPVRLRFATARHPATIGGEFIRIIQFEIPAIPTPRTSSWGPRARG
ncbi:MAG: hypothetical protein LBB23_02150 [Rickettsiales bacterium]|nr:hypothetical protein [Rickettsiales bacterium]